MTSRTAFAVLPLVLLCACGSGTSSPTARETQPSIPAVASMAVTPGAPTASATDVAPTPASVAHASPSSAASEPVPFVADCTPDRSTRRPSELILTCGDGGAYVDDIVWTTWGPTSADGAGNFSDNDCTPSCAEGTTGFRRRVQLQLSNPVAASNGSTFATLAVTPAIYGRTDYEMSTR